MHQTLTSSSQECFVDKSYKIGRNHIPQHHKYMENHKTSTQLIRKGELVIPLLPEALIHEPHSWNLLKQISGNLQTSEPFLRGLIQTP